MTLYAWTLSRTMSRRAPVVHLTADEGYTTLCGETITDDWQTGRRHERHFPGRRRRCQRCEVANRKDAGHD